MSDMNTLFSTITTLTTTFLLVEINVDSTFWNRTSHKVVESTLTLSNKKMSLN